VIANCEGDPRGALLLANDRLKNELRYFYELAIHLGPALLPDSDKRD
jgi:hypothetical protein